MAAASTVRMTGASRRAPTWVAVAGGAGGVGFHVFVIWHEEPALRAQFGDEYDDYRDCV